MVPYQKSWKIYCTISRVVGNPQTPSTNIRFLPAISSSSSGFAAMGHQRFFDPKYLTNPWEFHQKIFAALYLSLASTNFPFLRFQFYFWIPPLSKNLSYFVLLVVKLLIQPMTSVKFVHCCALQSKSLDTPGIYYKH